MRDKDVKKSWENFLNPEVVKFNLLFCSLYITAYEMLKNTIIDQIQSFFTSEWGPKGPVIGEKYYQELKVSKKEKHFLIPSLDWLKNMEALDESDILIFKSARKLRNEIAHELPNYLDRQISKDLLEMFRKVSDLNNKVGIWWIRNVEMAIDPDAYDGNIADEEIIPGTSMVMSILLDIVLGDEETSTQYYEEFKKRSKI